MRLTASLLLSEFFHGAEEQALEARFLDVQVAENFFVLDGSVGFGESAALGFVGDGGDVFRNRFVMGEGEDVGFEGAGPVRAPLVIGDGLGEHLFHGALRS